ncbi:MAG: DUF1214 domain-containing protein [Myxococcota bacterium]
MDTKAKDLINPVATAEQHDHEMRALELIQHPVVVEAFARVREHWLEQAAPSPAMRACFDASFEEVMFSAAIWSSNQDSARPKVVTITRLAHMVGDRSVPGSRWGIDNPDSVYRVIPISGNERYEIRGRVREKRLSENYFTLWDENMNTVDVLNGSELELEADGSFSISVDSDPAGDRANHVRSAPEAHEFYIRDVVQDWESETPNELEIERLGGAPSRPAPSADEQAELTARFMLHYADSTIRFNDQALEKPVNELAFRIDRDTDGALRNQLYIMGHFQLEDDQALVLDIQTGKAGYFIAPISNAWGTTNEIAERTGSLNLSQSVANDDGSYTFVLSPSDPGVHNWLDPTDMGEGILTLRWAEFPSGKPGADVSARSRVVPLSGLSGVLPGETRYVTPDERMSQCVERAAAYRRRLHAG